MAVSLSDKPNDNKPAAASEPAKGDNKEEKLDVTDSRLNNQTNVYGKTTEVDEGNADVNKQNEKSADVLAAAGASGDARVHNLLGQRTVAESNGDVDELKRIDKELSELHK